MTALLAVTFLLMQVLCQVFVTDGSRCDPPSGYVTVPEYNAAYKIHRDKLPWAEARDRCIEEGAHLAVITTFDKKRHVVNSTLLEEEIFMFIGLHRSATTRQWVRVDNGLPETSVPWSAIKDGREYDCAVLWRGVTGSFSNHECNYGLAFVCETSLAEACPSSVGHQN